MSLDTAVAAISDRAKSLWPGLEAAVPLAFPNETKATDGTELPPRNNAGQPMPFLMIEVRWSGGGFVSVGSPGNNLARREGLIWCFAFIPQGQGEARAHQLAAEAAGMFEGQAFSGVVCQAMEPGGEAGDEEGLYFGQSAAVPFDFDETA